MENQLLDLTPIYLQKTDTILNTLLFMCLDQGHDFHDGSARTKTTDGNPTWVDLDFKGKGYLNKIPQSKFNSIISTSGTTFLSKDIFGEYDFIKGLLNTTFIGGNGAYGLVAIDDEENKKLGINPTQTITNFINQNIKIIIELSGQNYYIYSKNDSNGDEGLTLNLADYNNAIISFLPFYQRVYNGGMHKLWSFNTKKYIYLIKLEQIIVNNNNGNYEGEVQGKTFSCEFFTTIDLVVPQYVLDFNNFIYNKTFNFFDEFKSKTGISFSTKQRKELLKNLNELSDNNKKIAFQIFSEKIFTKQFPVEGEEASEQNYFDNIPRGAKYYFANCQYPFLNFFLTELYKYQIPYIHDNYFANEQIKSESNLKNTNLLNNNKELLNTYKALKSVNDVVPENNNFFISKQYGFITDTNIGSATAMSTADKLIDSLNDISQNTECSSTEFLIGGGSELDFLKEAGFIDDEIKSFNQKFNSLVISDERKTKLIPDIMKKIKSSSNCNIIREQLITYLNGKKIPIDKVDSCPSVSELSIQPTIEEPILAPQPKPSSIFTPTKMSEAVTTGETITPLSLKRPISEISEDEMEDKYEPKEKISKNIIFDNIKNVNSIFDLKLTDKELINETSTDINSKSMKNNMLSYINNYSNKLQLYYDYIDQNNVDNQQNSNYFNNCWIASDFYELQNDNQEGGSNYPFKFTIASGSLDSSALGGQSIPQYHPPEVDIYMPIFDLGNTSELLGIIVRMVFVKKIQSNPINSKSQVAVFCHFVYVDFKRTNIKPPTDRSQYPTKFKELLEYTIKYTTYIKEDSDCIDIEILKSQTNINSDENIDFKLKFPDGSIRKWYKYYTFTQGPTVKNSIVIPTSYFTISALKIKASSDYVAEGIVNVAENIINNSETLRTIFGNNDNGKLLFMKLFLIRNKYTGDKSRSTDTLFLNQIKYLEGVQISNDENTLYNSQMFGLNTIWSTSSKSVFYMTPYITPNDKFPITNGSYVKNLCEGLKSNPKNKTITSTEGKSISSDINIYKKEFTDEIKQEILSKINPNLIKQMPDYFSLILNNTILEFWSEGLYNLEQLYEALEEYKNYSFDTQLESKINKYKSNGEDKRSFQTGTDDKGELNKYINLITSQISNDYNNFVEIFNLVNKQKIGLYSKFVDMAKTFKNNSTQLNQFNNMILFLSKNFPWWLDSILYNIKNEFNQKVCSDFIKILNYLNGLLTPDCPPCKDKFFIYKKIISTISYIEQTLPNFKVDCSTIIDNNDKQLLADKNCNETRASLIQPLTIKENPPKELEKYIKEIDAQSISQKSEKEQTEEIETNENKFRLASFNFLQKLKEIAKNQIGIDLTTDQGIKNDINRIIDMTSVELPIETSNLFVKPLQIVPERATERVETEKPYKMDEEDDFLGGRAVESVNNIPKLQTQTIQSKLGSNITGPELEPIQILDKNMDKAKGIEKTISKSEQNVITEKYLTNTNLNQFYTNSYKYNVRNYLQNFISIIQEINTKYNDLSLSPDDKMKEIIIKILLKNIQLINKSFVPEINSNDIINILQKLDDKYSIDQLNSISNTYSSQFDIYMIINGIMNTEYYTTEQLLNLLNDSITDNTYKQLDIPFPKPILNKMIIDEIRPIESDDEIDQVNEVDKVGKVGETEQIKTEGGNLINVSNIHNKKSRHRKKTHISKRTKNNKIKIKKHSLKKKYIKVKRNTKKNK